VLNIYSDHVFIPFSRSLGGNKSFVRYIRHVPFNVSNLCSGVLWFVGNEKYRENEPKNCEKWKKGRTFKESKHDDQDRKGWKMIEK